MYRRFHATATKFRNSWASMVIEGQSSKVNLVQLSNSDLKILGEWLISLAEAEEFVEVELSI